MGGEWSKPRPGRLTLGKTRYPMYSRLGEPQGRSIWVRKISPPPGFDPRTVQPVASRFTDCAIPAHVCVCVCVHIYIYIYTYTYAYIQSVSKPMSQTFPGYSPPPLKQKSSYQHGSKSEQVPRYRLTFMCWYPFEYYIRCSKCWPFAATHPFPADVALRAKMFGCMQVDDSERFLDTGALPHVHCRWHGRRRSGCLPLSKRVVFGLHHESNKK
jgi:hypothetical protein